MFDLFGIRRRKRERAAKEAARIADERRIYQQWLDRDMAQRQAAVMRPIAYRNPQQRGTSYGHPAPRVPEPDYITPMVIGAGIGMALASSNSHASEPERHQPTYSGDGGSFGGGGSSSSYSDSCASSSSYDSGSSSSDSGGGSCGGSD